MKSPVLAAVMAVAVVCVQPARAQSPTSLRHTPGQGGMALSGGAGIGWVRPACDFCRRHLDAGPALWLQMIGEVNRHVALGAEANLWARDDQAFVLLGSLSAIAQLRPHPESPLVFKGGLGYLTYRAYDGDGDLHANAPVVQVGTGYRFFLSNGLSLTGFTHLMASRFGTLRSTDDVVVHNFGVSAVQLGLTLTRF